MGKGAIWIGLAFIIFGIWLFSKMLSSNTPIWVLTYPIICIIIGISLIIFWKEEGKIEQRRDLKEKFKT